MKDDLYQRQTNHFMWFLVWQTVLWWSMCLTGCATVFGSRWSVWVSGGVLLWVAGATLWNLWRWQRLALRTEQT